MFNVMTHLNLVDALEVEDWNQAFGDRDEQDCMKEDLWAIREGLA